MGIIFLFLIQTALLDSFNPVGNFFTNLNFLLIGLILTVYFFDFRWVIGFGLTAGFLLDIYSSLPFGIFALSFFLTAVILEVLFLNFFTNRSFYSLVIMGAFGAAVYQLLFLGLNALFFLAGWSDFFIQRFYWTVAVQELAGTIVFLTVAFWVINILSKKFKPIFLS